MKQSIIISAFLLCSLPLLAQQGTLKGIFHNPCAGGHIEWTPEDEVPCTMTAVPETGYKFLRWADSGADNTDNPRTVNPTDYVVYKAIFVKEANVAFQAGSVTVDVTNEGDLMTPITYSLTVTQADPAFNAFTKWSNDKTNATIAYLTSEGAVTPLFGNDLRNQYNADCGAITWKDTIGGYILTAVPDDGYRLVKWEDNSTDLVRFVSYKEGSYTATFDVMPTGGVQGQSGYYATIADAITAGETNLKLLGELTEDVTIAAGKSITIDGNAQTLLGDISVENGAMLELTSALTVNNLYLNATKGVSSQLKGESNVTGQMWVDIQLEYNASTASDNKWYAISVPFNVDINSGVYHSDGTKATNITDYLAWEYDGALRATYTGMDGNGWVKMNKTTEGTMQAGRFYMFGIVGTDNVWRFQKTGAFGSTSVSLAEFPAGDDINKGWNAVGNATLVYSKATISGINYCQVYENDKANGYTPRSLSNTTFVMAAPFFVQTSANGTMTLTENNETNPQKRYISAQSYNPACELHLNSTEGANQDVLFLTTSDDAENKYVIGKDLAKLFGNNTRPYIWANAYSQRLCAQDTWVEDGAATYNISIYAPQAGTYVLQAADGNSEIHLLSGLSELADLSQGDYTLYLNAGTTNFTVVLGSIRTTTTALIEAAAASGNAQKVIKDNQLLIIINNCIYDAQGQPVK